MLREGPEQFNSFEKAPERMPDSDEREKMIEELNWIEERLGILKGTTAYIRHKEVGVPFDELYEGEKRHMEEFEKLEHRAQKIRDDAGFLLNE